MTRLARRSLLGAVRGVVATVGVVALLAGTAGTAAAADATGSVTATVIVDNAILLTGLTDFTLEGLPGVTQSANVGYNVYTNNLTGYSVSVTAAGDLTATNPANASTIPIGDLLLDGTAMTTAATTLATKAGPSVQGGDAYQNTYSMTIPFVPADTYTTTLAYVASTAL